MTAGRTLTIVALAVSLCAVAACGRRAGLDTPYDAAVQARKDAEKAGEPLPPEPTPPERNKRFFLDALID
jgi:predicted small lipoprotein YifL